MVAGNLFKSRTTTFLSLWYLTSLVTLFSNKWILQDYGGTANTLALTQMFSTCTYGALKVYALPSLSGHPSTNKDQLFYRNMALVGLMRFGTVILGLIGIKYVPISFVETVKSSAPFFTVIFSRIMLHERTTWMVNVSLVPVMAGLMLCSATELSFNAIGFTAALLNNCVDCIQNVYSKKLLTGTYDYVALQFYTSAAALVVQIPLWLVLLTFGQFNVNTPNTPMLWGWYWINGVSYHLQSVFAYGTMQNLTPVTHSVANTVKRALLIWLSVYVFHNPVAPLNGVGMVLVTVGVIAYNHANALSPRAPAPILPITNGRVDSTSPAT